MDDLIARLTQQFEGTHAIQFEITGAGMSRVFVAEERALNRKVVIKVLSPALAAAVRRTISRRASAMPTTRQGSPPAVMART